MLYILKKSYLCIGYCLDKCFALFVFQCLSLMLKSLMSGENKPTGLTGFDSEMKWFVSMQCVVGWHYNLRRHKFNWQ